VTAAGSFGNHDSIRLFFGLPLPASATDVLARWQARALEAAPGLRVVKPEHLHITLAFLGNRPVAELPSLREALTAANEGSEPPELTPVRYRETDHVAMLTLDDAEGRAAAIQSRLSGCLEQLGAYRPERRPWLPHVTVARYRTRPRRSPELPETGTIVPSDVALYHSVLRPDGAQYVIVEAVVLGGR
jgi:2'-5' RNA ligase